MKIYYTDHFVLPLPPGHRFPMAKYALLRERVSRSGFVPPHQLVEPAAATDAELMRVHDAQYVRAVRTGTLPAQEIRRIGFPWSPELVERSLRSVGATLAASRAALADGLAVNLAGGTHHAYADHGEGFCVFNDVAVAVRALQHEGLAQRFLVIDTDVHQGNGTAHLFREDAAVFTFSVHGDANYPFHKERSTFDVGLPDGAPDVAYLAAVRAGLDAAFDNGAFDLAFWVSGADAFEGDLLGRLQVSKSGLVQRDRLVLERCAEEGVPLVLVMGGGYAAKVDDVVDIHYASVAAAADFAARGEPSPTRR